MRNPLNNVIAPDAAPCAPYSHFTVPELLNPITTNEFFATYWNKKILYLEHQSSHGCSFEFLFPWERLNQVLAQYPMIPPRMMLVHKGYQIPVKEYLELDNGSPTRIVPNKFTALLSKGASLVLNYAEQLHEPLHSTMREFEKLLRIPVQANLYASWGTDHGFPLHWDEQHTFILQIAGEKRWTVYPPTSEAPLKKMRADPTRPFEEASFSRVIQAGDCLYVPRGWWHVVEPVGVPTLHVTVTCDMPTGIRLMEWLLNRLYNNASFRMDIPLNNDDVSVYANLLSEILSSELSDGDLLTKFWNSSMMRANRESQLSFPDLV